MRRSRDDRISLEQAARILHVDVADTEQLLQQHQVPYLPRRLWRQPIYGGYPVTFVTHVWPEGYPRQAVEELAEVRARAVCAL